MRAFQFDRLNRVAKQVDCAAMPARPNVTIGLFAWMLLPIHRLFAIQAVSPMKVGVFGNTLQWTRFSPSPIMGVEIASLDSSASPSSGAFLLLLSSHHQDRATGIVKALRFHRLGVVLRSRGPLQTPSGRQSVSGFAGGRQ